jgi:hypothetical protein
MHGKARSQQRSKISVAIRKREKAFRAGRIRAVLDSVLHRTRGGAHLQQVEDLDGSVHTAPDQVDKAANKYFEDVFSGKAGVTWYEDESVGEGVQAYFRDDAQGREAREAGLRGRFHEDWDALPDHLQHFRRMAQFPGSEWELGERERAFGDVLRPISAAEWCVEWAAKSRHTSGGESGVRPDMIKAGADVLTPVMCPLYSACIRLCIVPDQWKKAIVVPIEKVPGVLVVDKLRPLKLLEVTLKAVTSIIKNRIKRVVERLELLHGQQMAFRANRCTALAAMGVVAAAEDAMRYRKDLHVVTLDIRKAYDSVVRTVGKGVALRRLGVPEAVVEFLMELDRGNTNRVRTFWSEFLGDTAAEFEALRGFPQGGAEAPLLWLLFYNMVIAELIRRGVGRAVSIDIGSACGGEEGLEIFADDTATLATRVGDLQFALDVLAETLHLVQLRLAPEKSTHQALIFNRKGRAGGILLAEDAVAHQLQHRVQVGGVTIPYQEADVGVRYLGYWIDLLGDWGDQVHRINTTIDAFTASVRSAAISSPLLMYLLNHVLAPRVLYPLTVAAVNASEIDAMEARVLKWALRKVGVHGSYSRHLMAMPVQMGGLGWTRWSTRVLQDRLRLARQLCYHPEQRVRNIWKGMRHRFYHEIRSGRLLLGGHRTDLQTTIEEGGMKGSCPKSWMGSFDDLLRREGVEWEDGWALDPPRQGDVHIHELAHQAQAGGSISETGANAIRDGAEARDMYWLSQLVDEGGTRAPGWHKAKEWAWVEPLMRNAIHALPVDHQDLALGWHLPRSVRLGQWLNETSQASSSPGVSQVVWGQGIMIGSIVRSTNSARGLGVIRELGGASRPREVGVEWMPGDWCCEQPQQKPCSSCRKLGDGGRRWRVTSPLNATALPDITWTAAYKLRRVLGGEIGNTKSTTLVIMSIEDATRRLPPAVLLHMTGARFRVQWAKPHPGVSYPHEPGSERELIDEQIASEVTKLRAERAEESPDGWASRRWTQAALHEHRLRDNVVVSPPLLYADQQWLLPPDEVDEEWRGEGGGFTSIPPTHPDLISKLTARWATVGKGPLVVVTDGGFQRDCEVSYAADMAAPCAPRHHITSRSAGGWVMGWAGEEDDGDSPVPFMELAHGGGCDTPRGVTKASAYRSELCGVLLALRFLCHVASATNTVGPVTHWADNQAVCLLMNKTTTVTTNEWCKRAGRDMWVEIRERLKYWRRQGGSWSSSWVKGHIDKTDKPPAQYTAAERANILADNIATQVLINPTQHPPVHTAPMTYHLGPGGIIRGLNPSTGDWQHWWDDMDRMIVTHAAHRHSVQYWQARLKGRNQLAHGHRRRPAMDSRLHQCDAGPGNTASKLCSFRSRLWWDHLPSQAVRARDGHHRSQQALTRRCDLCDTESSCSTWHVLAECQVSQLREVRTAARKALLEKVDTLCQDHPTTHIRTAWSAMFPTGRGKWLRPTSWEEVIEPKAGERPNPWYGLFPCSVMDDLIEYRGSETPLSYDKAKKELLSLSLEAVRQCQAVWKVAGGLWRAREREKEMAAMLAKRAARTARNRVQRAAAARRTAEALRRTQREPIMRAQLEAASWKAETVAKTLRKTPHHIRATWDQDKRDLLTWQEWRPDRLLHWWRSTRIDRSRRAKLQAIRRENKTHRNRPDQTTILRFFGKTPTPRSTPRGSNDVPD